MEIIACHRTESLSEHERSVEANEENESLSHAELKNLLRSAMSQLLAEDPVLGDLHPDITQQEVAALLAVEAGRSMLVVVERADGKIWQLRVPRDARVHQLKAALRTHVMLQLHRQGNRHQISWRSVWRRHWLVDSVSGAKLKDDNALLTSLGIKHRHRLTFVKRDRERTGGRTKNTLM